MICFALFHRGRAEKCIAKYKSIIHTSIVRSSPCHLPLAQQDLPPWLECCIMQKRHHGGRDHVI